MTKAKNLIIMLCIIIALILIPNICKATDVSVERNIYSNNGSMKFTFSGLTLDKTHEYEYGLTRTVTEQAEEWYLVKEYTESTATVDIITTTDKLREVINDVDTGYITIRDKTTNVVTLQPFAVDLMTPFLQVTNYNVVPNGKEFSVSDYISVPLRNKSNSEAYYQYEKITDNNIINKYKEIKEKNGDFIELSDILKKDIPNSNWISWDAWEGYGVKGINGWGWTQREISVPDSGLYYMWIYFSGNNIKNVYGCILVDNLQPDIALEDISLPQPAKIELGKTLSLTPIYNPSNATNKMVTWSSSDESVATVDNTGKVTAKKVGSTIITVVSQDGSKKSACTVTVVDNNSNDNINNNNNQNSQNQQSPGTNNNNGTISNGSSNNELTTGKTDSTVAIGKLPQTGLKTGIITMIILVLCVAILVYFRYNKLKDIK